MSLLIQSFGLTENTRKTILMALALENKERGEGIDIIHLNKIIKNYQETTQKKEIEFTNYNLGAVSYEIEETIDFLIELNLIEQSNYNKYIITDYAKTIICDVLNLFNGDEIDNMKKSIKLLNDMSYNELLLYMYMKYPDTKENSTQKNKLEKMKQGILNSLLENGKINDDTYNKWINQPLN